jgi:putative oxidoreductase
MGGMGKKMIPIVSTALRLMLGAVFVYAGGLKALDANAFALQVENYRILGHVPSVALSLYLPYLEIFCGLSLISNVLYAGGLFITGFLNIAFIAALLSGWMRGLNIACGCFGSGDGRAHYGINLLRDIAMLGAVIFLYRRFHGERIAAPVPSSKQ